MPYSSVSKLPAHIKKYSAKVQRMWMHTFNSTWKSLTKKGIIGSDLEGRCFRAANSTIKRRVEQHSANTYTDNTFFHVIMDRYLGNLKG